MILNTQALGHVGLDATYFIGHGFGITSEMAGSIMVGQMVSNTHFLSFGGAQSTSSPGYTEPAENLNAFNQGVIVIGTSDEVQSNIDLSGPYFKLSYLF